MAGFLDQLIGMARDGVYPRTLKDFCLTWRDNPTDYAINHVVRCAAQADRFDVLCDALEDPRFRDQRRHLGGLNELRRDLKLGVDYFAHRQHDLLRYLRCLFLESSTRIEDVETVETHRRHCQDFQQFLQLDVPLKARQDQGLHRVLKRVFPLKIEPTPEDELRFRKGKDAWAAFEIHLIDYTLGKWCCRCREMTGHQERFKFQCPCGNLKGSGQLPSQPELCPQCYTAPTYVRCPSCGRRVTWDLMWELEAGAVHPTRCTIPVETRLRIESEDGPRELTLTLLELPVMLGMREQDNAIVFDLPALMWLDRIRASGFWRTNESIFAFREEILYDRQTNFCKVLEAVLQRTFRAYKAPGRSLKEQFKRLLVQQKSLPEDVCTTFSVGFQRRMTSGHNRICDRFRNEGDLLKFAGLSRECAVAASPTLKSHEALVNRQFLTGEGLVASTVKTVVAVLSKPKQRWRSDPQLSASPAGGEVLSHLDADGIVRVGAAVKTGDVLVGVVVRKPRPDLTAEEKLLTSIFGRADNPYTDESTTYDGLMPAKVLSVVIDVAKNVTLKEREPEGGKVVRRSGQAHLRRHELARITISLAVDYRPVVGDRLYADDGSFAVVCDLRTGANLAGLAELHQEPDILVGVDHPWAPKPGAVSARQVVVSIRSEDLLVHEAASRSVGPYSLIADEPLSNSGAQELTSQQVDWLVGRSANIVALELLGPHGNCRNWRVHLNESVVAGDGSLFSSREEASDLWVNAAGLEHMIKLFEGASLQMSVGKSESFCELGATAWVRSLSFGEVKQPVTIHYRTYVPINDGLFCERIFGPEKDWECACGKYRGMKYKGMICDRCGVKITHSRVRRKRCGHIELRTPIVHTWFYRGEPCLLGALLDMDADDLENVILYRSYVVLSAGGSKLKRRQTLDEDEYRAVRYEFGDAVEVGMGAEAIKRLLADLDLDRVARQLRRDLRNPARRKRHQAITERLALIEDCQNSSLRPERIIQDVLLVIPPDLRPLVLLDSGDFATSDLNDLYRRILDRNNRTRKLIELNAPEAIVRNEKRQLQLSVDALFENTRLSNPVLGSNHNPLVSIGDELQRFPKLFPSLLDRLVTKRIDYSGRTRVVAADIESIDRANLPEILAWDLLEPLLVRQLRANACATTKKEALRMVRQRGAVARATLGQVCAKAVVLAAVEGSPWPIVSLRVQLWDRQALGVSHELFDQLGWELLGQKVHLFALHSRQARREALRQLSPSGLRESPPAAHKSAADQHLKTRSLWHVKTDHVVAEFARRALRGEGFPTTTYDRLAACADDVL